MGLKQMGLTVGGVAAAVLSYFPLYTIEVLGFDTIGAGFLVAASQAGGAVPRLALGAASDRWMAGRRSAWLAGTAMVAAGVFAVYALGAFRTPLIAGLLAFRDGDRRLRVGRHLLRDECEDRRAEGCGSPQRDGLRLDRRGASLRPRPLRAPPRLAGPAIDHEARR